jgi:uncharacterized membrane protein
MRRAGLAIAAFGSAIAGYLTAVHYGGGEPACFIAHGCAVVQRSAYSELAGVPVALLGLLGYVVVAVGLFRDDELGRTVAAGSALSGAVFSIWLTVVELTRLHAICAWCVASAACMLVLAVICPLRLLRDPAPHQQA